jgi:hypothetical protein
VPQVPRIWGPWKPPPAWTGSPLQIISPRRCTMIQEVFLQIIVRQVLFAPLFTWKLPKEAKTSRNSLSWTILRGTSLLSGFYSATAPVNSRKQGTCLQDRVGGVRNQGREPAHHYGRIIMSHEKLCPVHRGFIAMSGRWAQLWEVRNEGGAGTGRPCLAKNSIQAGCPRSLAFGDLGDHEPRPRVSQVWIVRLGIVNVRTSSGIVPHPRVVFA